MRRSPYVLASDDSAYKIEERCLTYNQISSVRDVKHLAHLKKLLLGQNDITSFDAIAEVFKMPHLQGAFLRSQFVEYQGPNAVYCTG